MVVDVSREDGGGRWTGEVGEWLLESVENFPEMFCFSLQCIQASFDVLFLLGIYVCVVCWNVGFSALWLDAKHRGVMPANCLTKSIDEGLKVFHASVGLSPSY